MDALQKELAGVAAEYESFWTDLDEELKDELKKRDDGDNDQEEVKLDTKRLKEKYQEMMAFLSNEATRKYAEYLTLKPKQKVIYQAEHTELAWPDDSQKNANGTYKLPAIKAIIETVKYEIALPEEEDEYKIRHLFQLNQQISALKKEVKEIKTGLDNKAREAIVTLTDAQVKQLLREKWLAPAMNNINGIPAAIESELNRRIREIIQKYQNPISSLDTEIAETEKGLSAILNDLSGNAFDKAAIQQFMELLGGDPYE